MSASTPITTCLRKASFDSRRAGRDARARLIRHEGANGKELRVYKCSNCDQYHVGSKT